MKYLRLKYFVSMFRFIFLKIRFGDRVNTSGFRYFIGKDVSLEISSKSNLSLGDKVYLSDGCVVSCTGGNVKIGFNTFFNRDCKLISMQEIAIGDNCLFGPNTGIYDHNHKYSNPNELICKQGYDVKKIIIGSDVWIGANSVIAAGVTIGDRVVVGANSVVTKDLEPGGLYAGSPARLIKKI